MEDHKCTQIPHIKRLAKILDGNGQLGVVTDVVNLKNDMSEVKVHLESLSTSFAALAKNQLEEDITKKMGIASSDKRNRTILQVTAIIGAVGVIITAILNFG